MSSGGGEEYANILQTALLERTRRNMEMLVPEKKPAGPLPFAQNPDFFELYTEVYRVGIFPLVLSRRPVKALQTHYDWAKEGPQQLVTIMEDRSNPIFVGWDFAWDALWDETKIPKELLQKKEDANPKKDKGLMSSLLGWMGGDKGGAASKAASAASAAEVAKPQEGLFKMLVQHATRKGYLPLLYDDLKVFKGLVRVSPARIRDAWKEICQFHNQEFAFSGKEQTKPGATSEALMRWQFTLPDRVGEFLVIKAAVDLESIDKPFVQKYIRQSARTQEEAERSMPYLSQYWKAMK